MVILQEMHIKGTKYHCQQKIQETTGNRGLHTWKSTKEIQMHRNNHLLLGSRNYSQLGLNLSRMDRYDYNENIKYWEIMFPTRFMQSSRQVLVRSHKNLSHVMTNVSCSHHFGSI